MNRVKAYLKTLVVAIVGGYIFQILFVGFGMLLGRFFEPEFFYPNIAIIMIAGGWIFWFAAIVFKPFSRETWVKISVRGLAITVPFALIVMGVPMLFGFKLWNLWQFWALSVVASLIVTKLIWKPMTEIQ